MKTLTAFSLLLACHYCFAGGETNVIAISDWSKPVSTNNQTLRARIIIAQEHSPGHAGPWPETEVYVEFQNLTSGRGAPMQFYFDPENGLKCEVKNAKGKPPPVVGGGGSGGGNPPCWITLPGDSTIRLRANMFGYGKKTGSGLLIVLWGPSSTWDIQAGDKNTYYMSGTFTVAPPPNYAPKDFEAARAEWRGTLELPKMKLPVGK